MKNGWAVFLLSSLMVLTLSVSGYAQVEWDVQRTFNLEEAPLDVAISLNGRWVFVLTDPGEVHIYSHEGTLKGKISVGKGVDQIKPGPMEDVLFLGSRKNKTLQVITLDFVQEITITGSPVKGPNDAPVAVAVFSDFQSAACARLAPVLEQLLEKYPGKMKLVFKSFPQRGHSFARQAAAAALAADKQGKFWEFHDLLFKDHKRLNKQKIQEIVEELGLDQEKFRKDLRDPEIAEIITRDTTEGAKARVRRIPAVFINGRQARNTTLADLQAIIDKELEKAGKK